MQGPVGAGPAATVGRRSLGAGATAHERPRPRPSAPEDLVRGEGAEEIAPGSDTARPETTRQQDTDAVAVAAEFLKEAIRIRGVRIDRASFLRQELRKPHLDEATIDQAIATTPAQAAIPVAQLDEIASWAATVETNKPAALSCCAGLLRRTARGRRPRLRKAALHRRSRRGGRPDSRRARPGATDSFATTVTKAVPVAGGVISGSTTLVSLRTQPVRLATTRAGLRSFAGSATVFSVDRRSGRGRRSQRWICVLQSAGTRSSGPGTLCSSGRDCGGASSGPRNVCSLRES